MAPQKSRLPRARRGNASRHQTLEDDATRHPTRTGIHPGKRGVRGVDENGNEHLGPVEGVRCVITGHTPVPEPTWHENVLAIDTGVHIAERGYGRLTIAQIDGREIETLSFNR